MKKVSLIILSVCLVTLSICNVKAENITYKKLGNIYYNLTVDGKTQSNHVTAFYLGNRLAYCIEPGKEITTKTYDTYKDWSRSSLSQETRDYIEKIGYYGYEYPGHQTDKYYIATEELIWKAIKPVDIKWTTGQNNTGNIINVEAEKNAILNLIQENNKKPSFENQIINGEIGETKELEDTNNVLNNYEIKDSKYHQIKIENNKLKITFSKNQVEEEITLTKKHYDSNTLLVYVKEGSQQLAALRISVPEESKIKIKSTKTPEEIVKVPSTSDDDILKHYNVIWKIKNDVKKFN